MHDKLVRIYKRVVGRHIFIHIWSQIAHVWQGGKIRSLFQR